MKFSSSLISFLLLLSECIYAQDGTLDTTFSADGKYTNSLGSNDFGYAVAIQPDGKIVVSGSSGTIVTATFSISRYLPDATKDLTFGGGDGEVVTDVGITHSYAKSIALQADGKIITAGYADELGTYRGAIVRYMPDGSTDDDFGDDGVFYYDTGVDEKFFGVWVQPDQKIVAAGSRNSDFLAIRLNPDGTFDSTFNDDGKATFAFGVYDYGKCMLMQPDGKIIIAGNSDSNFGMLRLNADGYPDDTFGDDGFVTTDFGMVDIAYTIALDPSGKIILAGYTSDIGINEVAVARYLSNGALDLSFSGDGKLTGFFGAGNHYCNAVTTQDDGKIILGGVELIEENDNAILARLTTDGILDTTFNHDGLLTTDFNGFDDAVYSLVMLPESKILAVGSAGTTYQYDTGMAKYISSYYGCIPIAETCNGLDDNCNGIIDEGITETITISAAGPLSFCKGESVVLNAIYSGETIQWKKNGYEIPGATSPSYTATKKGFYSCVTFTDCDTTISESKFVNVLKGPSASITADGPTTFCDGGHVTLTANTGLLLTYQWLKDGSAIPGATAINYIAETAGNYKCRVTKAFTGCIKNSNEIIVTVPCRSTGDGNNDFILFPNPAKTFLHIVCNENYQNSELNVIDATGKIIRKLHVSSSEINLDIEPFAPGIYFLQFINGTVSATAKFVKE